MKKMKIANIKKAENWNNQVRKGSDQSSGNLQALKIRKETNI
jgi:hypothetical protein